MAPEKNESMLDSGWLLGGMVAVLILLGVALWYVAANPDQVAEWVNPDDNTATVSKPQAAVK